MRFETLDEIASNEWDALAGEHVFLRHGYLRAVQEYTLAPLEIRLWLSRDRDGIRAAIVCYQVSGGPRITPLDTVLFGRFAGPARRLGLQTAPALIAGTPVGNAPPILIHNGLSPEEQDKTAAELVAGLQQQAEAQGLTLCFRNVPGADLDRLKGGQNYRFFTSEEMPTAILDVRWTSFEGYLRWLRGQHPKTAANIGNRVNRARRMGFRVSEVDDLGDMESIVHRYFNEHYRRLNGIDWPFRQGFLAALKDNLGDSANIYIARQGGELLGAQLVFRGGRSLWTPTVGFNPALARETGVYFHLTYHDLIRRAGEEGFKRIYYGKLTYQVKIQRGCRLHPLRLLIQPGNPLQNAILRPLLAYRRRWYERTMEPLRPALVTEGARSA